MDILKILVFIFLVIGGYKWWQSMEVAELTSPAGFIPVQMPDRAEADTVIIFAPKNCPREPGKRADKLGSELERLGIPYVRSSSFSVYIPDPSAEQQQALKRSGSVLEGEIPAVFINGMGKSNPTAEDVVAEYNRTVHGSD
jgi:hypothetical protein